MTSTSELTAGSESLTAREATHRQGSTAPGTAPPGTVLVAAIVPHKVGPPPKHGLDERVRYLPGQQYHLDVDRAIRAEQLGHVYRIGSYSVDWWGAPGRVLSPWPKDAESCYAREEQPGALRIVQGVGYDPGSSAYRLHAAINATTKHASAFARWADSNPHCSLRQYDGIADAAKVRQAILEADVIHCHVDYLLLNNAGLARRAGQLLVRHYHGSVHPTQAEQLGWWTHLDPKKDKAMRAVLVGARLTLLEEAAKLSAQIGEPVDIDWLPITVPVARYRRLSRKRPATSPPDAFRIAHCPTKRSNKGTAEFLTVCDRLQAKGLKVIPVLMEMVPHGEALERKATCDATFDSFWLGIQTSGLEGGAMRHPVIAGDPDVAALYRQHVGEVPYTFANDAGELERVIERLATDKAYHKAETERVARYVEQWHDYPAVGRIYEGILAKHLGRDDVFTTHPRPDA